MQRPTNTGFCSLRDEHPAQPCATAATATATALQSCALVGQVGGRYAEFALDSQHIRMNSRIASKNFTWITCWLALLLASASARCQDCIPNLSLWRFTETGRPVFLVSLVPGANSCQQQFSVALEWSEDLQSWHTLAPSGDNCLTPGAVLQMADTTVNQTVRQRFYRVIAYPGCF
jgi:hypothetical protein